MIDLIFIPPLYAWFNIYGFWDPYGNTNGIKVAVAIRTKAPTTRCSAKSILATRSSTLKSNDQLGWEFMSRSRR